MRPKIAYITLTDPNNRHSWSGTHYYLWKALQKNVGDVDLLGPIKPFWATITGKLITGISQKLLGKRYNYSHSQMMARAYARIANKKLAAKKYDLVVVPATSTFITYLETSAPIAYIGDATVECSRNYHRALTGLYDFSWKETRKVEEMALKKASFLVYSSSWAAQSAIKDFGIAPEKVFVISFGANIDEPPARATALNKKEANTYNLLFMGVSWEDKGGAIAYDAFVELNKIGIDTTLTVCGCLPPEKYKHEKLKVIPFVNKNESKGFELFSSLFTQASFFILPTRFDCTPIVFCESFAFGLPVISANTGGLASLITNDQTGYLMPYNADGKEYAQQIAKMFGDKSGYEQMRINCRDQYEKTFNWDNWSHQFKEAYYKACLNK